MIMTRSERLVSCKQCKNRYLDFNKGVFFGAFLKKRSQKMYRELVKAS